MYESIEQMSKYMDDVTNQSCTFIFVELYRAREELGGTRFELKVFI